MKLECRIGVMSAGLDQFGPLTGLSEFISNNFRDASNGDISLTCSAPEMIESPLPSSTPVSALGLNNALFYLLKNPNTPPISRIGVLLADSYDYPVPALGVMFDRGFTTEDDPSGVSFYTSVPREGCAVFLGTISKMRVTQLEYLEEVFFTAVHELGHVFNLEHDDNSPNFMKTSDVKAPYGQGGCHFNPDAKRWLSCCSTNPNVTPGGSPFGETGTFANLNLLPRLPHPTVPFGLELLIDCSPREFWQFEPVQLEITLRKIGGLSPNVEVPDELDPGYRRFHLMIEDPLGERRLYRSTKHFCGIGQVRKIGVNKPYHRDLPVFGQAGGYTFRRAGVHRLWIEFETGDGILRSNTLEVFVKPELGADPLHGQSRRHLSNPRVANVLFHREDLPDGKGLLSLSKYIDNFPKAPSAAEIHYTIGRASLARAGRVKKNVTSLYEKAADHLKRSLDDEQLGPHRQRKAQAILDNLPRTSPKTSSKKKGR